MLFNVEDGFLKASRRRWEGMEGKDRQGSDSERLHYGNVIYLLILLHIVKSECTVTVEMDEQYKEYMERKGDDFLKIPDCEYSVLFCITNLCSLLF